MKRDEFKQLMLSAFEMAVQNAEQALGMSIPREFQIKLHGAATGDEKK